MKAYQDEKADEVSGIETPDDQTLVINLTEPSGIIADGSALGMPCTVPIPKDYAQKYDEGKQSTYGQHQVFTGPYMIENDGKGKITGYEPSKRLVLVRNPSWDKDTDFKPAYFDRIVETCCSDATVAARKTLSDQGYLSGDYAAPPTAVLKQALSSRKDQISVEPSGGNRYISLNTTVKPLDNVNVRRAISAVIDRNALRQTRGGPTLGTTATHFMPPGIAGYEEAGGVEGPGFDFTSNPKADVALAKQYMQKAGYENGMYDGPPLLTVADNESPAKETAEAFQSQVAKIGIKLQLRQLPHATANSKYCLVPKSNTAICPNLGWGHDFFAAQSFIDPLFNGKNIVQSGNVNTAEVNDPELNAQIDEAKQITDPERGGAGLGRPRQGSDGPVLLHHLAVGQQHRPPVEQHERSQQQVQLRGLGLRVQLVQVERAGRRAKECDEPETPAPARRGLGCLRNSEGSVEADGALHHPAPDLGRRAAGRSSAS